MHHKWYQNKIRIKIPKSLTEKDGSKLKYSDSDCDTEDIPLRRRSSRKTAITAPELNVTDIKEEELVINYSLDSESDFEPPKPKKNIKIKNKDSKTKKKRKYDSGKTWNCKKCPKVFLTFSLLRDHRKIHSKKDVPEDHTYKFDVVQDLYICNTCSAEFQEETEVKDHIKDRHENEYSCTQCDQSFKTLYEMGSHSGTHHAEGHVMCPLCNYKSPKKGALLIHINYVHLKKFAYFCQKCGKGFNDHLLYKEHENEHLGVRPFGCVVCGKSFTYTRYLYTHQVRAHRVSIDGQLLPNQCPYCNRKYSKPETLEKHMEETHFKPGPHEKKHLCDTCGKGFAQRSKLVIHERVHTGYKPYACRYCEKCFTKKDYLVMHERVHSGEKPYSCEYCGKCFSQGAPLRIHLRIHTGEKPYQCQFCLMRFSSRGALNMHKNCAAMSNVSYESSTIRKRVKHRSKGNIPDPIVVTDKTGSLQNNFEDDDNDTLSNKELRHQCRVCFKTYPSLRLLNFHRKIHKLEEQEPLYSLDSSKTVFQCNSCILVFHNEPDVKAHVDSHSYSCPICQEKFSKAILLGCHMAEHNEDGSVSCPLCQYQYSTPYGNILQAHIKRRHLKMGCHYCEHCGASYYKKKQLVEHINVVHLKQEPYKCVVCDREFIMKTSLYKHQVDKHRVLVEGDIPSNYCLLCKRTFQKVSSLEKHLEEKHHKAKHKKEETYICDTCGKEFGYRQSLKVHQKGHAGLRPHKCSFCPKTFKLNSQKLDHEAVHTNLRPFSCEQCGQRFKLIKALRVHLKIHQVEKDFICDFCARGYNRADHFRLHQKSCRKNPINVRSRFENAE